MERIGIYSGPFDPPHLGHFQRAQYARKALNLDKIFMIPDPIASGRQLSSPNPKQRLEMLLLGTQQEMGIEPIAIPAGVDPCCTSGFLTQILDRYPNAELYWLMDADILPTVLRQESEILRYGAFAVFARNGWNENAAVLQAKQQIETMGAEVLLLDDPIIDISPEQLHRMLAFGCASEFLPEPVEKYIYERGLYRTKDSYRNLPSDELEQAVVGLLKPDRVRHVLGCRQTAVELARLYGVDETDAARAALLHDITKALDAPLQLTLCRAYGTILDAFSAKNPKTLHALTGSLVAERIFGENKAVVDAIRCHTTGKTDMNLLEKIIYVADYMEPNRDFPGVEKLRQLAYEDITQALKLGLQMTLAMLKEQGREISPESSSALRYLESNCGNAVI